jgi:hypothetical protein
LCLIAALVGCSGQYYLTAPDQLAPAGGSATAVVRIQRHEFMGIALAVKNAPLRLWVTDQPLRAAFADKKGYAGAVVPVPDKEGLYSLTVATQDIRGDEFSKDFPTYVWPASQPIVVVDLECVPLGPKAPAAVGEALNRLAKNANIVYFTSRDVNDYPRVHEQLQGNHLPDGPVLPWRKSDWINTALVSQLPQMRQQFSAVNIGICSSAAAAGAFSAAGMDCVVVGNEKVTAARAVYRSWADLAAKGL